MCTGGVPLKYNKNEALLSSDHARQTTILARYNKIDSRHYQICFCTCDAGAVARQYPGTPGAAHGKLAAGHARIAPSHPPLTADSAHPSSCRTPSPRRPPLHCRHPHVLVSYSPAPSLPPRSPPPYIPSRPRSPPSSSCPCREPASRRWRQTSRPSFPAEPTPAAAASPHPLCSPPPPRPRCARTPSRTAVGRPTPPAAATPPRRGRETPTARHPLAGARSLPGAPSRHRRRGRAR
mmetsp:Transcript_7316/g.11503  ORF Transcript_7316/g.11503 Transcript_7316/m.11503 type:complete len:236 (+) Transcript_7316:1932-2639(+)